MVDRVVDFLQARPARLYGLAVAVLALVAVYVPGVPQGEVLAVVAAVVAVATGESVQRVEDRKTEHGF